MALKNKNFTINLDFEIKNHVLPLLESLTNLQLNMSLLKNNNTEELREDCQSLSRNLYKSIQDSEKIESILQVLTNATKLIKFNLAEVKAKVDIFIGTLASKKEEQKL